MEYAKRPTVRTQFLVFTLFGDYILPRGGTIWTSDLLNLLALLDVSERAARSVLSRMTRKGWLKTHRKGRHSQYSLTPQGWILLEEGGQRIFEPSFIDWDEQWHVVIYSLPEKKRNLRHALCQRLIWLGFGRLAAATWVSPHNRNAELETIFNELDIKEYVEVFSGIRRDTSSVNGLIQNCWDLPQLETEYRDFIAHYQVEYEECIRQGNGKPALSSDACFVRRFWLTHDFQPFPLKDPNLPTALLSSDWIGFKARQLFEKYRQFLETDTDKFIDKIVKREETSSTLDG